MSYINICTGCGKPFTATTASDKRCDRCEDKKRELDRELAWAKSDLKERGKCV